jgi:tRNA pseudouridine55 synthase
MDGVLVVDKPVGLTSHDVVARVRRAVGERRVGHTGTLDPGASGVLPLVIGRATRLARFISAGEKTYEAVIRLGVATDTGDSDGIPLGPDDPAAMPSAMAVDSALNAFRGTFTQQPPAFSAKKIDGRRSHRLARARRRQAALATDPAVRPPPSELPAPVVVTAQVDLLDIDERTLRLRVHCSAGFYVRALARDLGNRLGTGGHVVHLRRTCSGDFTLAHAVALDVLERNRERALGATVPLSRMLPGFPSVVLTPEGVQRALHGRDLGPDDMVHRFDAGSDRTWVRLFTEQGALVGLARLIAPLGALHPSIVLL